MNEADPLSDVLRSVSLTGAVFLSAELGAPWGFAAPAASTVGHLLAPGTEHIVLFHLVIDGKAKVRVPGQEDLMLAPGDIVVLPRGDAHELWSGPRRTFTDSSSLLPRILGGALASERGGGDGPLTQFVCGYIGCDATPIDSFWRGCRRRSRSTCAATRPARGSRARSVISRREQRLARGPPRAARQAGGGPVHRRPAAVHGRAAVERTGWLAAARDPAVGRALACLHREPAHPWTLAELAQRAGVSRSVCWPSTSRA